MPVPDEPWVYHIVHVDRLASIIASDGLFSDAAMRAREPVGTTIGMGSIKDRRMGLRLPSYPDLAVGACVPFYFCSKSVMLYMMHVRNAELAYKGGQEPIIHLVAKLKEVVDWANDNDARWAFTLSSAASNFFEDRTNLNDLGDLNWNAIEAKYWSDCRDAKQSEFLLEHHFPWHLVRGIAVHNQAIGQQVGETLATADHRPQVKVLRGWYY